MKCQAVRNDAITASGILPPLFDLPAKVPEVFKAFFRSLESDFPLDLSGMESQGGTKYSDLKLVLDVDRGRTHCELTPAVILNHFRNVTTNDQSWIMRFGRLYEAAVKTVFPEMVVRDRVYRLHTWLRIESATPMEDALRLLEERGTAALALNGERFRGMKKEFTIRADLKGENENVSYLVQKSAIPDSQLYVETAVQFFGGRENDVEHHYDATLALFAELLKELGLDA
jgi:hypothetical protein